jgi:hypothetical protein
MHTLFNFFPPLPLTVFIFVSPIFAGEGQGEGEQYARELRMVWMPRIPCIS